MGSQVIAALDPVSGEVCLRSSDGQDTWITYRADLDGSWFMTRSPEPFVVGAIWLAGCKDAFGWLLPESPFSLQWNGRPWQTLARAWSCIDSPKLGAERDRIFQHVYYTRLLQHPYLLRRFASICYPMRLIQKPWLAEQIEVLRVGMARGPALHTHEDG